MILQFQSKKEKKSASVEIAGCVGCIHRTFSSLSSKPQGFMLNGTNHILRGSALFGTAACCRWCPKNILFVYFAI